MIDIPSLWTYKELPIKVRGELHGYRWVTDVFFNSIYIVEIKINNYYYKKPYGIELDYLAEDWTIVAITDAIHNKEIDRIPWETHAHYLNHVEYFVGNHVTNEEAYFCMTIQDLITSQYKMMKAIEKICLLGDKDKKAAIARAETIYPEWRKNE